MQFPALFIHLFPCKTPIHLRACKYNASPEEKHTIFARARACNYTLARSLKANSFTIISIRVQRIHFSRLFAYKSAPRAHTIEKAAKVSRRGREKRTEVLDGNEKSSRVRRRRRNNYTVFLRLDAWLQHRFTKVKVPYYALSKAKQPRRRRQIVASKRREKHFSETRARSCILMAARERVTRRLFG